MHCFKKFLIENDSVNGKSELHNKENLNFTTKRRNSYSTNFVEE